MSLPRRTRTPPHDGERLRRDPRSERVVPTEQAAVSTAPARTRRDPRAERGPGAPEGVNVRIDRARPLRFVEETTVPERPRSRTVSGPRTVIIDSPACWVLAVPDLAEGRLSSHDRDTLGAARRLADACAGAVVVAAFGDNAELGAAGADRVVLFDEDRTLPEARVAAIQAVVETLKPRHILFSDDAGSGSDLGRRLAAELGEMPATQIQAINADHILSRGDGGRSDFKRPPPRLLLIAPEAAAPLSGVLHEARPIAAPEYGPSPARIVDRGLLPVDPAAVPLVEAELIVSAGNGVSDWPAFHALAAALGASEGCSRPVCDAGNLPRDRQIGASGTLVSARGYIALGISGAPQHLQGITDCEHVIAVNKDPHAEIMKRANLAVIADVQQLMPALSDLLNSDSVNHN